MYILNKLSRQLANFHKKKTPGPKRFIVQFYKHFKKKMIPLSYNFFQKIEFPNTFYEISINLISKPGKDIIRKENCRPISHEYTC